MEIPRSLHLFLCDQGAIEDEKEPLRLSSLQQWNENVEAVFINPMLPSITADAEIDILEDIASSLRYRILSSVARSCSRDESTPDVRLDSPASSDDEADNEAQRVAALARDHFESINDNEKLKMVTELVRCCKNLLRYNSQVVSPQLGVQQEKPVLRRLISNGMLELYLAILRTRHNHSARYASLSLFYCIYNPMDEESTRRTQSHLLDKLGLLEILSGLLLQSRPTDFVLTLVRHVHNLISSTQEAFGRINVILMKLSAYPSRHHDAPWLESTTRNSLDLVSLLVGIANWCVRSKPTFPGEQGDRRADLVSECIRVLLVLRAATSLLSDGEENVAKLLVGDILRLSDVDGRNNACKLTTISFLMDAPPIFSDYLVENHCIEPLLSILEAQVSDVVDHGITGNQAAAALTPILVVLNNVSVANAAVRQVVKNRVFPPEAEAEFQKKVEEEMSSSGGSGAKNMSPLDAPENTLRWKLIRLMTWTESHTKRLTSELFWTLCGSDSREFVLRTGFGNAMPHLACKGVIPIPPEMR